MATRILPALDLFEVEEVIGHEADGVHHFQLINNVVDALACESALISEDLKAKHK